MAEFSGQPVSVGYDYKALHISAKTTSVTPVGAQVSTTSATTITAGQQTVTPASLANIVVGMQLYFAGGTGTAEAVRVQSVNVAAGTFVATFANGHSGGYTITSLLGTRLGLVVINAPGTSITLTLYDGCPTVGSQPVTGQALAVITPVSGMPPMPFNVKCDNGLWYACTGTTAGDYTLTYQDMVV